MKMIDNILDSLQGTHRADPKIRIKIKRGIIATTTEGKRAVEAGEIIEIRQSELKYLEQDDFERVDKPGKKAEPVKVITPERPEIKPLPDTWKNLPDCFADYWQAAEKLRVAAEHVQLIEDERFRVTGLRSNVSGEGQLLVINPSFPSDKRNANVFLDNRQIDLSDPVFRAQVEAFNQAHASAVDHLAECRRTYKAKAQRAWIECGLHALEVCESLSGELVILRETAVQIFAERVASLELSRTKIESLFHGSGVYEKYVKAAPATIAPRSVFVGDGHRIADAPAQQLAGWARSAMERRKQVATLQAQADAELAKVRKLAA